jgi:hypothetical protein
VHLKAGGAAKGDRYVAKGSNLIASVFKPVSTGSLRTGHRIMIFGVCSARCATPYSFNAGSHVPQRGREVVGGLYQLFLTQKSLLPAAVAMHCSWVVNPQFVAPSARRGIFIARTAAVSFYAFKKFLASLRGLYRGCYALRRTRELYHGNLSVFVWLIIQQCLTPISLKSRFAYSIMISARKIRLDETFHRNWRSQNQREH